MGVGCCAGIAFSWFVVARRLREETERVRRPDPGRLLRRPLPATAATPCASPPRSIILFFFTFYVAAQFLAAGKVLNFYLGIPPVRACCIGAVLVLFYTAAGGLLAVSWTDLVQGIIMLITLAVLPLAVLAELGGPAGCRPSWPPSAAPT